MSHIHNRLSRLSLLVCSLTLLMPLTFLSAETNSKNIVLGTSTKGGGFQLFGQTLAEVVNNTTTGLQIEAIATKGSKENLSLLEAGKIDIGLVEGNAARQALQGIGRPIANLKTLYVMYPNPGMFVVRTDSPYHNIDDLKGKTLAMGTKASGLRILGTDILDGLGMQAGRDYIQVLLDKAGHGPPMILNKQVDAFWGAGIGWPGFVKVANAPGGARFIAPNASQQKQILAKHPHLRPMSVPANTYTGQTETVDSLGLWSIILIRPGMDEAAVYNLTRAIHQSEAALTAQLSQGRYTTAKNTLAQIEQNALHPGALRYFRESGLINKQ